MHSTQREKGEAAGTVCSDQPKGSPKALETFFLPCLIRHKDPKSLENAALHMGWQQRQNQPMASLACSTGTVDLCPALSLLGDDDVGRKATETPTEPLLCHCTPVPAPKSCMSGSVAKLNAFAQTSEQVRDDRTRPAKLWAGLVALGWPCLCSW